MTKCASGASVLLLGIWLAVAAMAEESFLRPADRQSLRSPDFGLDALDRSRDLIRHHNGGQGVSGNDGSSLSYDSETGTYHLRWREGKNKPRKLGEWVPAWQMHVTVAASVECQTDKERLSYRYKVKNGTRSRHRLQCFRLMCPGTVGQCSADSSSARSDTSSPIRGTEWLDGVQWTFGVGVSSSEAMPPGESACFTIESRHPPTVVNCWARSNAPIMRVDGEEPGDLDLATMFYYGSFDEECYGLTIGPGYATTTIEQVRGYLPVCLQQGWISGYPFVKDLDAPLGKAQKLRDSGDVSGMVSALEETVKKLEEVRSYKRKTYEVTHEAYALIRYNCEHLIRQHSDKE